MGKSILKLLNFDINMTKFGCYLQVIPLPSLPLPLCQYISKLICTMFLLSTYSTTSIYGVLYSHSVSIHSIYIFFSLSTCQQCSYIFCVYLSTDLSHCIYKVSIFLQCWSIYLSLSMSVYRQFKSFFLCLNTDTVFDYILNKWRQCLSIYIVYLPKLLIYLKCTYFYSIV